MVALEQRRVPGAIIVTILLVTAVGIALGVSEAGGIISLPPSLAPTFLQLDIVVALETGLIPIVFAFLFVDLDRKSVVSGKSLSVRVDLGGGRIIKKKTQTK